MDLKLFISYRRNDSSDATGRIDDHLVNVFGRRNVFKDVDSIPFGADFRKTLSQAVGRCDVLLVVVGPGWLRSADEAGNRRLDCDADYVRVEIEAALRRDIPVVPLLLGDTPMVRPEDLPEPIRELAFRNAARVRRDPDFRADIDRVVKSIKDAARPPAAVPGKKAGPARRWRSRPALIGLLATLAVCAAGAFVHLFPAHPARPDDLEKVRQSVKVRASVGKEVVATSKDGTKRHTYSIWVDAPPDVLDRIDQVLYNYNNINFVHPRTVSWDRKNKFMDQYDGYGSVDGTMYVTLVLRDGRTTVLTFNMYQYIHQ